jgi:hypothetical protein
MEVLYHFTAKGARFFTKQGFIKMHPEASGRKALCLNFANFA